MGEYIPLTLKECDALLNKRRVVGGDLHPDFINAEMKVFKDKIEKTKLTEKEMIRRLRKEALRHG
jgi:hypothetical protein